MKAVLQWIKSNPILLIAAVLCLSALGTLVVLHLNGSEFKKMLSDRASKIAELDGMGDTTAQIPPANPDDQPISVNFTINPTIIEKFNDIYGSMNFQYKDIQSLVGSFSEHGDGRSHVIMKTGLFPDPGEENHLLFEAGTVYRKAFAEMLKPYSSFAGYPRLDAGGPYALWQAGEELQRVEDEFLIRSGERMERSDLDEDELEEMAKLKRKRLLHLLQVHASRIHIYAKTDPQSDQYPFELGGWSLQGTQPDIADVWEGQMGLWLQQDIVQAIAVTNRVSDPDANVMTAPVKQLVRIQVGNSYVGLELKPIVRKTGGESGQDGRGGRSGLGGAGRGGGAGGSARGGGGAGRGGANRGGGGSGLATGFSATPTGRESNDIYDVRLVMIEVLVEWQRLPQFIASLAQTNFMTVLKTDIQDVDEYEALQKGYIYGTGDVVRATMLIESLWIREWTSALMPDDVKRAMGIAVEENNDDGNADNNSQRNQ